MLAQAFLTVVRAQAQPEAREHGGTWAPAGRLPPEARAAAAPARWPLTGPEVHRW